MKKIVSIFLIIIMIVSCVCFSANAQSDFEYSERISGSVPYGCDTYYNVRINGIYYNIYFYRNKKGKIRNTLVEACYSTRKGDILKYPDKIKFKGYTLKVDSVYVYSIYASEYQGDYKFPYKEIYTPKYATDVSYGFANLSKLKKIYISKNVRALSGLDGYQKLKVKIDKKNKYIKMKNGAIYSKNGKELRTLVNAKKTYKISKGTKEVNIIRNNKVEKVVFPNDLKKVNSFSDVSYCNNLKTIKFGKDTERIDMYIAKCKSLEKIEFGEKLKWFQGIIRGVKALESIEFPATLESLNGCYIYAEKLNKIIFNNEKHAPEIKNVFFSAKKGVKFYVKNQIVADELSKTLLEETGVRNANIYINDTIVYSNITGKQSSEDYEWDA